MVWEELCIYGRYHAIQQKGKPASPGKGYRHLLPLLLAGMLSLPPLAVYAVEGEAGYWERIAHVIAAMDNGGGNEVLTQIEPGEGIPAEILRVLQSRDVTLVVLCDGKRLRINGQQMYPVSDSQDSYSWDDLSAIYATPPGPGEASSEPPLEPSEMESSPDASESASAEAILSHELPPREGQTPILIAAEPSEQDSTSDTASEPSGQEEYLPVSARTEVHRPVYPLLIAGGVILVAAAGGGAAIYFGILRDRLRKKQDESSEESGEDGADEEDGKDKKDQEMKDGEDKGEKAAPSSEPALKPAAEEATVGKS